MAANNIEKGSQITISPEPSSAPELSSEILNSVPAPGMKRASFWRDPILWFTTALTIFGVAPFLQPGYHWGANDARHHVYFLFEFNRLVEDGIWWPRWSPDFAFGYGYPFFNIYGPFSHFLAEILLHFFNFSYTGAIETVFCISIVGSAMAMYGFMRSWAGWRAGIVSALVYVYAPYHLLNLYVRANLAESMAFVWLPLVLWALRTSIVKPTIWSAIGLAVSMACLLMTSQLVTILFAPLLVLYGITLLWLHTLPDGRSNLLLPPWVRFWLWAKKLLTPALGAAGALGLSAIFWLPMVMERQYVRQDQWFSGRYDFHGHFVYFYQLFSPFWGFGVSEVGPDDPFGFQIGVVPLLLALLGVALVWHKIGKIRWEIAIFIVVGVGATFISTRLAAPLWDLPIIGQILGVAQFPWRWLNMTTLCVSVLAGLAMHPLAEFAQEAGLSSAQQEIQRANRQPAWLHSKRLDIPLLAVVIVILLGSYPFLQVQITEPAEGPVNLASLMRFQQTSDEMTGSTVWVKEIPRWSVMADEYMRQEANGEPVTPVTTKVDYSATNYNCETGSIIVGSIEHNSIMEKVYYCSGKLDARIVYNHFYYPGWHAYLWNEETDEPIRELAIKPNEDDPLGRMAVSVPEGEGYVMLRFEDTPPRVLGKQISQLSLGLFALIGLLTLGYQWRTKNS